MFFMMFFDEKIRKTKEETETKPVGNVSKSCYSSSSLESLVCFQNILCGPESHVKFGGSMSDIRM